MNAKHTPGPWVHAGTTVFALTTDSGRNAVNRFSACVQSAGQEHEATFSECRANARVMAAAPDLLAALQAMNACLSLPASYLQWTAANELACAAIARATSTPAAR